MRSSVVGVLVFFNPDHGSKPHSSATKSFLGSCLYFRKGRMIYVHCTCQNKGTVRMTVERISWSQWKRPAPFGNRTRVARFTVYHVLSQPDNPAAHCVIVCMIRLHACAHWLCFVTPVSEEPEQNLRHDFSIL
jgi:hypothetical protein